MWRRWASILVSCSACGALEVGDLDPPAVGLTVWPEEPRLGGFGSRLAARDGRVAIGGMDARMVEVHRFEGERWIREAGIRPEGDEAVFGEGIAIGAGLLAISGRSALDAPVDRVFVYRLGGVWTLEEALVFPGSVVLSVAFHGTTLAVARSEPGRVLVELGEGPGWRTSSSVEVVLDEGESAQPATLASGEGWIALGLPGRRVSGQPSAGSVHVVKEVNGSWRLDAILIAGVPGALDGFGGALAAAGDTLVVGAPLDAVDGHGVRQEALTHSFGAAHAFRRIAPGAWVPEARLGLPDAAREDQFGTALAIGQGEIWVGAPRRSSPEHPRAGVVARFARGEDGWTLVHTFTSPRPEHGGGFGTAIARLGRFTLVGEPGAERPAATPQRAGAVRIFAD